MSVVMTNYVCTFQAEVMAIYWAAKQVTELWLDTRKECSSFNDFFRESKSAEEEETVIHFRCQCPSLARCRYRLFGYPSLVISRELTSIDVKDTASFITIYYTPTYLST